MATCAAAALRCAPSVSDSSNTRRSGVTGVPTAGLLRRTQFAKSTGITMAGDSINAIAAAMWPPRMALGSTVAIKHAVRAGLGLAVLSRHTLAADPATDALAVLPVTGFPIRRMWHLVWRRDRPLSLPARTLLADLRQRLKVRSRPAV